MLALVVLALLHVGGGMADAVDGHPDGLELAGVVPVGHLRADQTGVGTPGLLDEGGDRARAQGHVVVAEEQVAGPLHGLQHLVGRGAEAGVDVDPAHEPARAGGGHPLGRVLAAAGVDDQDGEVRVVLGREGAQALLEPRTGFVGHHDRDDGGRGRTGGRRRGVGGGFVHDPRRLAARSPPRGTPGNPFVTSTGRRRGAPIARCGHRYRGRHVALRCCSHRCAARWSWPARPST